ncbi:MAG: endonuclease/exonuclease/phosphatase family protein [Flavobacteriales bacterium]|nr:endonuclease/exonuclease/phosphatase family protein [Flavobacteriales bacterium]
MKKLGTFRKIVFWVNALVALLLVISFVLPYLPPKSFPTLSLLSLGVSPLILVNVIFVVYWLLQWRRQMWLSAIILFFAYFHFNPFFEFSSEGDSEAYNHTLTVLSFNVRLFNAYEEKPSEDVLTRFAELISQEQPDVICVQEYYRKSPISISGYPYQYTRFKDDKANLGHAIFSKYPLINTGAFDFTDSYNNVLFADVLKAEDTVRVYNLHLQSLGISPKMEALQEGNKERLRKRLARSFIQQQAQVDFVRDHKKNVGHPVILCGDFNNTPFSYTYHKLQQGFQDAFVERGSGLGTTFKFDGYPMRIDYILASEELDVLNFKTISNSFSDHYPISATVGWDLKPTD